MGEERVDIAYVPSVPSGTGVTILTEQLAGTGVGSQLHAYALDGHTIGISPLILEDWNRACVLRMECTFERAGDRTIVKLPERIADWYRLDRLEESDYKLIPDPDRTRVQVDLTPLIERMARR